MNKTLKFLVGLASGSTAIDVGCGTLENSIALASLGFQVLAIDLIDYQPLLISSGFADLITFVNEDIRHFESTRDFDICLCISVLNFLTEEQITYCLKKLKIWTKTNGIIYISCFMGESPSGNFNYFFKPNELKEYFKSEWTIINYKEYSLQDKHRKNNTHQIARIIARKT